MTPPSAEFAAAEVAPLAEPVFGFRAFMIDEGTPDSDTNSPILSNWPGEFGHTRRGLLRSVYKTEYRWGPGVNVSHCERALRESTFLRAPDDPHEDERPIRDCMCGFWAYTAGDHYLTVPGYIAFGIIEAWGGLVVGPAGFRAQKARIRALCFPSMSTGGGVKSILANADPHVTPMHYTDALGHAYRSILSGFVAQQARTAHAFACLAAKARGEQPPPPPEPPQNEAVDHAVEYLRRRVAPADLIADCKNIYRVPTFDTVSAMQAEFPVSDLTPFLPDGDDR